LLTNLLDIVPLDRRLDPEKYKTKKTRMAEARYYADEMFS
jgi:hypothetical protein